MGTTLIYSAALLFLATITTASNVAVSSIPASTTTSTITTTTTASILPPTIETTAAPKLKRGVVDIGTNIWANTGSYQSKSATPGTSAVTVNQNGDLHSPQRVGSTSSSYSPAQSSSRTSVYNNNPNSGYRLAAPYSGLSYGNVGQTQGSSEPSFGSSGQSYVSSPHNYGSTVQGQNSGYSALYSPQSQSQSTQSSPSFASYRSSTPAENSQSAGQIQNGAIRTPYYGSFASSPSQVKIFTEKLPAAQYGSSIIQIPQEQHNFPKSQQMYAPNHQSASYSIPNVSSYPYQQGSSSSQGSPYATHGGPVPAATSQIPRNALKNNYPGLKNAEYAQVYAPQHQSASHFVPSVQSNGFGPATVDFDGKKIPLPILQLQSAEDFPGFGQSFNAQPLILESNTAQFPVQAEFSFLNDFAKTYAPQNGNLLPFYNSQEINQPQVLPVRSSNGSPQFPQYKGARLITSPDFDQGKPSASYEPLTTQPQLHFTGKPAPLSVPAAPYSTSSIIHHPLSSGKPTQDIRTDVEVINKKKRPSPPPSDSDDDDEDEGYKSIEREYGRQHDDAEDDAPHGKHFKESNAEGDFKPSRAFPFKSYDDQFHKYSKPSSDDDSEEDRPSSRYRHSSAEDEDDYEGYSSSRNADYRSPKARPSRYEDDEEESQKQERNEEADEEEERPRRPSAYSSYGKDFEEEFEDSYRRELPKSKYVHIKEVPEIEETTSSYKSKNKGRKNHEHSHDEDPEESKHHNSQTQHKYGKAQKPRDNDGHSSTIRSYKKGKSPKVVHEDSYGYKTPEATSYSKFRKSPTGDSYSTVKKTPKTDSYVQASRSSYKSPKNDKAYENGDAYSYSSGSSWKSDKKSPETGDSHGHSTIPVKSLALPERNKSSFRAAAIGRGNLSFSKSEKMVRDLTGI